IIRHPEAANPTQNELISFQEILDLVKESLATEITQTKTEIKSDFSSLAKIPFPRVYLQSIIYNLVSNAIKYRSPDRIPVIKLTSYCRGDQYFFACQDNGLGIDLKKYGHKIFELYSTFHHHKNSRGVGLHITKNQLEARGGNIRVESQVNQGSTFIVNFGDIIGLAT
ncbi:MAG: ATP-binding protein, partial [Bacteroidota bacterium]